MPQISANDIDAIRRQNNRTEALLRVWGSKGYKVLDLYKIFGRIKFITCMRALHPYS